MKWGLKVSLKYSTPPSDLRVSRSRTLLYTAASQISLILSAGPRFPASSTVRSNQSSMSSSYLYHEVGPSKSAGFLTLIPFDAVYWSVVSTRHAPPNDSAKEKFEKPGTSTKSSSQSLIGEQPIYNKTPFFTRSSITNAPLPLCGCESVVCV